MSPLLALSGHPDGSAALSASLIGRLGQALSGYPPVRCRCRSQARASLRTRHQGPSIMGFRGSGGTIFTAALPWMNGPPAVDGRVFAETSVSAHIWLTADISGRMVTDASGHI